MITTPIVDCVTDIGNGKEKGDMTDRSINRSDKRCVWSLIHLVDFFFSLLGMLCGTMTGKKKKKKMMYLTSKNAGVPSMLFTIWKHNILQLPFYG